MASKDDVPDIGFDPLAWMKDSPKEPAAVVAESAQTAEVHVETKLEAQAPAKNRGRKKSVDKGKTKGKKSKAGDAKTEVLRLSDSLDISHVNDLSSLLKSRLDQPADIALDGSGVGRVDGAALQLLSACAKEAQAKGIDFRWIAASDSLTSGAKLLGLADTLRLH
ncbi:MAG TPA: STAS domain-containing protein [Acidiferrobacteraceae bacterium]|nr:STAS domain-containing protein [Acidiferrobacteraceae bacterium]